MREIRAAHDFSEVEMVDRVATDLCLVSVRSHRLTQLHHRLHDRLQLLDAEEGLAVCDKRKHRQLAAEVAGCRQRGVTGAVRAACGGQSVHALQQPCRRCARLCGHHVGNVVRTRVAAHITLWPVETARCIFPTRPLFPSFNAVHPCVRIFIVTSTASHKTLVVSRPLTFPGLVVGGSAVGPYEKLSSTLSL